MTMTHNGPSTVRERRNLLMFGAALVAIAFMLLAGALRHTLGEIVSDTLVGAGAIAGLIAVTIYFLGLDEASRQAHYVAWTWGGCLGAAVIVLAAMPFLLAVPRNDRIPTLVATLFGEANLQNAFFAGVGVILVPMLLGYALWWSAFWLRRR